MEKKILKNFCEKENALLYGSFKTINTHLPLKMPSIKYILLILIQLVIILRKIRSLTEQK